MFQHVSTQQQFRYMILYITYLINIIIITLFLLPRFGVMSTQRSPKKPNLGRVALLKEIPFLFTSFVNPLDPPEIFKVLHDFGPNGHE